MALKITSVDFAYEAGTSIATPALSGVDLTLERGEVVVCVGATGSGKSTLLRLCAGLLEPTQGSVEVDGLSSVSRGSIGIVFQNPETQFFAETVTADVSFGPRNLGMDDVESAWQAALADVGLDPESFGPRSPFTLSGGEARRVAIAGVLAMRTPYLLLDEPTAGLDPSGRHAVLEAIKRAATTAGVLVVTHDAEEFLPWADRILALYEGGVVFEGRPLELAETPGLWEQAGLSLPQIVLAQHLARARGARIDTLALDVDGAARVLAASAEGQL